MKIKIILLLFVLVLFVTGAYYSKYKKESIEGRVLQITDSVNLSAQISSCILDLTVYPEKRIPSVNNWGTQLDVQIYSLTNNFEGSFVTNTNNFGNAVINVCDEGIYVADGTYNIYIKGFSHLRKNYANINSFATSESSVDVTPDGDLLAGETSNIYDNYINTLDLSTQYATFGTFSLKNDLNRDDTVNSLDISNTVTNFYINGDCSPQELANNICE